MTYDSDRRTTIRIFITGTALAEQSYSQQLCRDVFLYVCPQNLLRGLIDKTALLISMKFGRRLSPVVKISNLAQCHSKDCRLVL